MAPVTSLVRRVEFSEVSDFGDSLARVEWSVVGWPHVAMDPEIRAQFEETRRHFDVVAEGMRSDTRLVAEGVSSLADRVDRLEQNLREEIRETRRDLTALLTASHTDLDRRVRRLEDDR